MYVASATVCTAYSTQFVLLFACASHLFDCFNTYHTKLHGNGKILLNGVNSKTPGQIAIEGDKEVDDGENGTHRKLQSYNLYS